MKNKNQPFQQRKESWKGGNKLNYKLYLIETIIRKRMYEHQEEVRWHGCKDIYLSAEDCDIILEKLEQIKELDPPKLLYCPKCDMITEVRACNCESVDCMLHKKKGNDWSWVCVGNSMHGGCWTDEADKFDKSHNKLTIDLKERLIEAWETYDDEINEQIQRTLDPPVFNPKRDIPWQLIVEYEDDIQRAKEGIV